MGFDLSSSAGEFSWNYFSWHKLMRLAQAYGWEPAGTVLPDEELKHYPDGVWAGSYISNDGQMVMREDAEQLAAALENALPHIPDTDVLERHRGDEGGIEIAPNGPTINDADWFCGPEHKSYIRDFISYCRKDGFTIC